MLPCALPPTVAGNSVVPRRRSVGGRQDSALSTSLVAVLQLAAGPHATGPDNAPAATVLARTGRSWRTAAEERQAAAASAPVAQRDMPPVMTVSCPSQTAAERA